MKEVFVDKYMYLTYYIHLAGIKRSDCMPPLFSPFGLHDSDLDLWYLSVRRSF
jgi:hypothetical protein